jgi:hypothetical protein
VGDIIIISATGVGAAKVRPATGDAIMPAAAGVAAAFCLVVMKGLAASACTAASGMGWKLICSAGTQACSLLTTEVGSGDLKKDITGLTSTGLVGGASCSMLPRSMLVAEAGVARKPDMGLTGLRPGMALPLGIGEASLGVLSMSARLGVGATDWKPAKSSGVLS